jgi:hypothetical protein
MANGLDSSAMVAKDLAWSADVLQVQCEGNRYAAQLRSDFELSDRFHRLYEETSAYSDMLKVARADVIYGEALTGTAHYVQYKHFAKNDADSNTAALQKDEAVTLNISIVEEDDVSVATATVHLVDNTPALENARSVLDWWLVSPRSRKKLEKLIADEQASIKEQRDTGQHEAADKREQRFVWWVWFYALRWWGFGLSALLVEARKMIGGG